MAFNGHSSHIIYYRTRHTILNNTTTVATQCSLIPKCLGMRPPHTGCIDHSCVAGSDPGSGVLALAARLSTAYDESRTLFTLPRSLCSIFTGFSPARLPPPLWVGRAPVVAGAGLMVVRGLAKLRLLAAIAAAAVAAAAAAAGLGTVDKR